MNSSESLKDIAPALAAAQAEFKGVGKSGFNKFDNYAYGNLDDFVRTVQPVLGAHGLSVLTSLEEVTRLDDRTTQKGGIEHVVQVKLVVRLLHTSSEWYEVNAYGEGQDRADKAIYKAITGARKYGLAMLCDLATTDDPEADERDEGDGKGKFVDPRSAAKGKPAEPPKQAKQPAADPLEEFPEFRKQLSAAFKARAFSPAAQKAAVDSAITKLKIGKLERTTVKQRRAIIDSVIEGKADGHKYPSANAAAAAEGAAA